MLNDLAGREKLFALGLRQGPVVARGGKYVWGQNLREVAEFVGLHTATPQLDVTGTGHQLLPPDQLLHKWVFALHAAQRYVRQIPSDRLNDSIISTSDRSIRIVAHHLFRIGEAFIETVVDGAPWVMMHHAIPPLDGTFTTGAEIARYGDSVIARLQRWWDGLRDESTKPLERMLDTYHGTMPVYLLYERCTWHSAQHARQLSAVLERFGIEPDGRLTADDLAGLPMPDGIWV